MPISRRRCATPYDITRYRPRTARGVAIKPNVAGIGTDALADVAEGRSRDPPAGNPEIRSGRLSPALDERLGKPDLSVQFECARLHRDRT
jgi:hypothetical protein